MSFVYFPLMLYINFSLSCYLIGRNYLYTTEFAVLKLLYSFRVTRSQEFDKKIKKYIIKTYFVFDDGDEVKMYTVKEVAKLLNMTEHTVRYYTDMGLVPSLKRDKNGNRLFDEKSKN
jgi:hypothetical protein